MAALQPLPGFNWMQVAWGAPDELVAEQCSYCDEPIPDDDVPLIMCRADDWVARFCPACRVTWWGFSAPRPRAPDDDDDDY
jgi:hypothetical protein